MPEADTKPAVPAPDFQEENPPFQEENPPSSEQDDKITLRVCDENNNEFTFMMRRTTQFRKIFDAFAERVNENVRHFRFHYDGLRLAEDDSPDRIGLNDGDMIEAFVLAEGG